jgi:retron-type reverse transcriptase
MPMMVGNPGECAVGVPTRRDRVRPMVVKNALEPRFEAAFEAPRSGCRPGRCGQAAIEAVDVVLNPSAVGHHYDLLDAEIPGAFDQISQDFRLPRIGPMPGRELIKPWRQAGYWEHGTRHHTTEGTPQGGVCSPWLAKSAREGRAKQLGQGSRVARYADDMVVMAKRLPLLRRRAPWSPPVSTHGDWRSIRRTPTWCSGPRALMVSGARCRGEGRNS